MGKERLEESCFSQFSKVVLILVNLGFVVSGSLLIYFSLKVNNSGWLDVFKDEYAWLKGATFWGMVFFGVIVILIASLGCLGAWMKNKCLLTTYVICIVLSMILFVLIAIGGFSAMNTADTWKGKDYPASENEVTTAVTFHEVYCLSQGLTLCLSGNITDTIGAFDKSLIKLVGSRFNQISNIPSLCSTAKKSMPNILSKIQPLCKACEKSKDYEKYKSISEWALDKCQPNDKTLTFCAQFLKNGAAFTEAEKKKYGENIAGTPYEHCRVKFLDLWGRWSSALAIGTLIIAMACLFILIFTIVLRKRVGSQRNDYYA